MYILRNIKIPYDADDGALKKAIEYKIHKKIDSYTIYKKSTNAWDGVFYVYQALINTI